MKKPLKQILFWTPRILSILFVIFISIFALDVFGQGYGFWETLAALLIHLLPSIVLAIAIALAWRWEWIGAVLFFGFAAWYLTAVRGFHWDVYLAMAGAPFLVAALFLVGWIYRKQIRSS